MCYQWNKLCIIFNNILCEIDLLLDETHFIHGTFKTNASNVSILTHVGTMDIVKTVVSRRSNFAK